jgi:hypothetical protein
MLKPDDRDLLVRHQKKLRVQRITFFISTVTLVLFGATWIELPFSWPRTISFLLSVISLLYVIASGAAHIISLRFIHKIKLEDREDDRLFEAELLTHQERNNDK